MKVATQGEATQTIHRRWFTVEDGLVIDAGYAYAPGTRIKVEKVRFKWDEGDQIGQINVEGHRVNKDGSLGKIEHEVRFFRYNGYPEWLLDLIAETDHNPPRSLLV